MGWVKGQALFSGNCGKCGKKIEKGETVFSEIKGLLPITNPNLRAICEDCFKKYHPNEKADSPTKNLLKRMTFRLG